MTDVLILSYHAISDDWPAALSVTPDALERQVSALLERGYRPATVHDAIHAPPAPKTLALTFDDAYRSVLELGLPVLARLGVPATVFAATDYIGSERPMVWPGIDNWVGGPHAAETTPLSWDELRSLAVAGWEVGSHTCSHPWLTGLSDEQLQRELRTSRERCEAELGGPCRSIAYPFGDHDGRVVAATAAAGYTAAVTVPDDLVEYGPLRWPRVGIYHHDGTALSFRAKVSPVVRALRRSPPAPPALRIVRRGLAAARSRR